MNIFPYKIPQNYEKGIFVAFQNQFYSVISSITYKKPLMFEVTVVTLNCKSEVIEYFSPIEIPQNYAKTLL